MTDPSATQPYLLCDYIPGQSLTFKQVSDATSEQRVEIFSDLINIYAQFFNLRFPATRSDIDGFLKITPRRLVEFEPLHPMMVCNSADTPSTMPFSSSTSNFLRLISSPIIPILPRTSAKSMVGYMVAPWGLMLNSQLKLRVR